MYRAILLGIISLLLLSFEAGAATYYVKCDADTSGVGTFADPLNTVDGSRQAKDDT